jgi:tetratricopeptide (TPR) repeat protein
MKIAELSIERELSPILVEAPIFHRIDIEYTAILKNYSKKKIAQQLISGLRGNLHHAVKSFVWESQIDTQLDHITSRIALHSSRLLPGIRHAYQDDAKLSNRRYVKRERPEERLASHALLRVLEADGAEKLAEIQSAKRLLKHSIQKNSQNYQTQFELAWLALFYLRDYETAQIHFKLSAQYAKQNNHLFFIFAQRHLAKSYYEKGDYLQAEDAMSEVLNSRLHPDPEYQYEYARYLASMGELKLAALYLSQAIEKLPIYYTQASAEPDFKDKGIISQLLDTYKQQSLKYIREQSQSAWQQCQLSKLNLPLEVSTQQVFQETCDKHVAEIQKHPIVIVKKNQPQITAQLLNYAKQALLTQLVNEEEHCMKKIVHKRSNWKLVNKSGGILIHAASILLLATLFVLASKYILVAVGLGASFYFDELTSQTFVAVLFLGLVGTYLLRSQPFGVKRLFQKSLLFKNAKQLIHKLQ